MRPSTAGNEVDWSRRGALQQLLTYGTKSYTWNNFWQLESMTDSDPNGDGDTSDSETSTYEYDLYGNLLSVGLPDGRTIEYDVDGAGRGVGRRELDPSGNEISFRGWIYRNLLRPIAEVDALGNVVARYVYGDSYGINQDGLEQLAVRLGGRQGERNDDVDPEKLAARHVPEWVVEFDGSGMPVRTLRVMFGQNGTVKAIADTVDGSIAQRLEYDSFGRVLVETNPGLQPFGFAGGMTDPETGAVRFGARDYFPETGTWGGRDPRRFNGGSRNVYAYVNGDPINFIDIDGEAVVVVVVVIVVILTTTTGCGNNCVKDLKKKKKKKKKDLFDEKCLGSGGGKVLDFGESEKVGGMSDPKRQAACDALKDAIDTQTPFCRSPSGL